MPPECTVEECTKPARGRGWCEAHYARYRRHGDPLGGRWTEAIPPGVEADGLVGGDSLETEEHGGAWDQVGPSEPPDPRPVEALRMELQRLRSQDVSFSLAWSAAVQLALAPLPSQTRREWQLALHETRSAWQSAFYRMPAPEQRALGLLRLEDEGEPWMVFRREPPQVVLHDHAHDRPSKLEPVVVPWCS
jgi:hypothetical protein